MNEIFPCLTCYGQKLIFLFGNRDKDKRKLCEKEAAKMKLKQFISKVIFTVYFNQFFLVSIHK